MCLVVAECIRRCWLPLLVSCSAVMAWNVVSSLPSLLYSPGVVSRYARVVSPRRALDLGRDASSKASCELPTLIIPDCIATLSVGTLLSPTHTTHPTMPRKSASLVPHAVSSLLKGGYMKAVPAFYPAVLNNPPLSIPPRTPYTRTSDDLPANVVRQRKVQSEREQGDAASHPRRTQRYYKSRTPSLKPQPIEYLEDRVRKQFFKDHPWEGFQPRHLVEKEVLDEPRVAPKEVTELVWWSTNPQPEE